MKTKILGIEIEVPKRNNRPRWKRDYSIIRDFLENEYKHPSE